MDIFYIAVIVVFFLLSWGLMKVCDVLGNFDSGEKR
jgi:hypothetical protein